jgi:hypothetical protein
MYRYLYSFLFISLSLYAFDSCTQEGQVYTYSHSTELTQTCTGYHSSGVAPPPSVIVGCTGLSMSVKTTNYELCPNFSSTKYITTQYFDVSYECPPDHTPDANNQCQPNPTDNDGDGVPDSEDPDDDNDGIPDASDSMPNDHDNDGIDDADDPDDDNDGLNDDVNDPYPNDHDNDGTPDVIDEDSDNDGVSDEQERIQGTDPLDEGSIPSDEKADKTNCNSYPPYPDSLGWQVVAQTTSFVCTIDNLNRRPTVDGSMTFYTRTDSYTCNPKCLAFLQQCPSGENYSYAHRGCVRPDLDETDCEEDEPVIQMFNGACYEVYNCKITGEYNRRVPIDCPDENNDGVPDDNITQSDANQDLLSALKQADVATSKKQDTTNQLLDLNNEKLNDIKANTNKTNLLLQSTNDNLNLIDSKLTDLTNINNTTNSNLASIDASLSTLSNINALSNTKLDSLIDGQDYTNQLLEEIRDKDSNQSSSENNISVDLNTSEIESMMRGEGAELDYVYDPLNEGLGLYANFSLFPDQACPQFDTVAGNVFGSQIVFFSQDTVNQLPMNYIRSAVIFSFVILAFIFVFRGN